MNSAEGSVKCVVWDLDNTLWSGTLLEGDAVELRPGVEDIIRELDARGILQSVASRNDPDAATEKLSELKLDDYFLYPQISWGAKSAAVATIAQQLNIDTDAVAFVDDEPFERDEVAASLPDVLCIDAADIDGILDRPELMPRFITEDSARRRSMYQAEIERKSEEAAMAPGEFLASLDMMLTIAEAIAGDMARVEELTLRTNQLNSTGYTFTYDELENYRESDDHSLLVAELTDRYGSYGKIGVALVDRSGPAWLIRLILMSCRVMSRGVGKIMLSHILQEAARGEAKVRAEFVRTPRNRPMYLTFKLAGFSEIERDGDHAVLQHDLSVIDPFPAHVVVETTGMS